jgi:hypothetical protein
MARDAIIGTWAVTHFQGSVAKYKYKYTCSAGKPGSGTVTWRDYWDASENGSGTWSRSGDQINFVWRNSSTSLEYLIMAPTSQGDQASGEARASYGNFSLVAERLDINDPKQDLMQQWADNYGDYTSPYICPWAIPYLLKMPKGHAPYNQNQIGGAIGKINGLAVHTTWSSPSLTEEAAVGSAITQWSGAPTKTGAHFIIGREGTLIQVVPLNRIAYAQGGNGDPFWISVEIQTKESPANPQQLQSARILFQWICNTRNVPQRLATGFIGKAADNALAQYAKGKYDPITTDLCGDATTTRTDVSIASTGLSCHYWLHPVKPCPGEPLLKQLKDIVG